MFKTVQLFCFGLLLFTLFHACKTPKPVVSNENLLERLLAANPQAFDHVLKNRDSLRVQIVYTRIDRDKRNRPHFTDYHFNVNKGLYFYPASTAKMPVAFLALEKMHRLGLSAGSTMITEKGYAGQTLVYNDPTSKDGRPTVEQYVKKLFVVSDNDANNRLYEFLGQEYINRELHKKGYGDVQILHRLGVSMPDDQQRNTNPVSFRDSGNKVIYSQANVNSSYVYQQRSDFVGRGYMQGDVLMQTPMNFSQKNRIQLTDLHQMLRSVLFPESVPAKQRFDLGENDYRFLYQCMSQLPRETTYPAYDVKEQYDSYVKFFMYGTQKEKQIPTTLRLFNKVGWAYGFLTDVAYIVDFEKNIEFMLSATIYCNEDGILNDDKYDYEKIGLPFLEQLGQTIYQHEVQRERKHQPDLSMFKVKYDQ